MSLPPRDLAFWVFDWLGAEALCGRARHAHLDRGDMEAVLALADQIARERFAPHAARSDAEEPRIVDGRVVLIPEMADALEAYRGAGFFALDVPLEEGGLQLPHVLDAATGALFSAACIGTVAYPFLTRAAANLIRRFGDDDQKQRWLPPMVEGRWYGTMCLSEPHAGSSVGDIRTQAHPRDDGRYSLRGTKTWISTGDHELSDNIVHLVLAKIPGGPAGTRGISLFAVPKYRVDADGRNTGSNGVTLVGLNHKMGYRASVNCVLSFGDNGECIGELVGAPHEGMRIMFSMMNEARIGTGIGAAALGHAGYLEALRYAHERRQGRPPSGKDPNTPMVPLTMHADVRRMLLRAKALSEGAMALCLYAARLTDEIETDGPDAADARALLDLLTPIVKAWPSEHALAANDLAIQVLGGAGYTRDFPVERLYRDNRLNAIHEGTTGIQAQDLLGRKVLGDGGRVLGLLCERIEATIGACRGDAALAPLGEALADWLPALAEAVRTVGGAAMQGDADLALANAYPFLDALGHVVVAWLWLDQARVAGALLADATGEQQRSLLSGKRLAATYFIEWELPTRRHALALVARLDRVPLDADVAML